MNTYEIRFRRSDGNMATVNLEATDYAKAIVEWRRRYPSSVMAWARRMEPAPPDNRLPREGD